MITASRCVVWLNGCNIMEVAVSLNVEKVGGTRPLVFATKTSLPTQHKYEYMQLLYPMLKSPNRSLKMVVGSGRLIVAVHSCWL